MEGVGNSYFMLYCFFHLLTGSHMFKPGLELSMQRRLAPRVRSSFLCSFAEASRPAVWTNGDRTQTSGTLPSQNRDQEGSCVRRILSACENTRSTRKESCNLSFLKAQNYSWTEGPCSSQMSRKGMSLLQSIHYCLLLLFN